MSHLHQDSLIPLETGRPSLGPDRSCKGLLKRWLKRTANPLSDINGTWLFANGFQRGRIRIKVNSRQFRGRTGRTEIVRSAGS